MLGAINYISNLPQNVEDVSREGDRLKVNLNRRERVPFVTVQLSQNEKYCTKQPPLQESDSLRCLILKNLTWTTSMRSFGI